MTENRYPEEVLDDLNEDDGTMPENVATLREAVVGHRVVSAGPERVKVPRWSWSSQSDLVEMELFTITLDNGKRVVLRDTSDCCAYTYLHDFLLDPSAVDHMILGVGTTDEYTTWHVYADWGDVLKLEVGWSCGNPFYYGYGFDIQVQEIPDA